VIFWLIGMTMYKPTNSRGSSRRLIPTIHEKRNSASEKEDQGKNWLLFAQGFEPWEAPKEQSKLKS
jgi:hypothetical protein